MKTYGKLTADQFRDLVGKLPELRGQRDEFGHLMSSLTKAEFDKLMPRHFAWGGLYELSFAQHISLAILAFNRKAWFDSLASVEDPQQKILDDWAKDGDDFEPAPHWEKHEVIALAYSLQRTILSVMLFQRSMSGLIQEVREQDNMDSLFNAVRVDRAALECPTIADKIARAQMRNDKAFFLRLRNAIKGPTQKHWAAYCDLRYSLFVLRELGFDKLTDDQLEHLLVHTLGVYPNNPSARKNLRAQYQKSKKIKTI